MSNEIESFLKLLLDFRALPETKRRQTFMEVSGYPHFENVCSNILGFYFDPSAEHGLKNLLISSFLSMAEVGDFEIPDQVEVTREYPADDQQRIDLVVDCDIFTLGIENKIYHWEANDFENYARVIERLGMNKKVVKAVLCLRKDEQQAQPKGGFQRYTYGELWQQVRRMLGDYINQANPKWVTCLLDFMETTTNLAGGNMEHKKLDQFFIENDELLERMFAERNGFYTRLNQKVAAIKEMVEKMDEAKKLSRPPFIWEKRCVALYFNFKNVYALTLDLWLSPKGWELHLFGRDGKSKGHLDQLVKQPPLKSQVTGERVWGERYLLAKWNLEAGLDEISEVLRSWMRVIIDTDAAGQTEERTPPEASIL